MRNFVHFSNRKCDPAEWREWSRLCSISRRRSTNGNWLIQTFFGRARRGRSVAVRGGRPPRQFRWNQSAEDEREMNKACFYLDKALKVFHNCFPLMAAKAVKEAALFGHEMGNKKKQQQKKAKKYNK
uniref:Uncharacterized protein n=1 Tax=Globodera rostochiensis TaxID=31243 RepID=A0A914H4F4_GLORO